MSDTQTRQGKIAPSLNLPPPMPAFAGVGRFGLLDDPVEVVMAPLQRSRTSTGEGVERGGFESCELPHSGAE